MRARHLFVGLMALALAWPAVGQHVDRPGLDVVAYYDENDIVKQAYRESPYFLELTGSWKQRATDSSVVYTKKIEAEKSWKDYLVYLNTRCGRACRVYVNDKEVGYGDDSRHWNTFLLNKYLKYGKTNTLSIEAMKNPAGALLEDSTIGVGLNGEPYIMFKNDPNVHDIGLTADYDAATQSGTLSVDATIFNSSRKGKYYVEVEVWDPDGRQLDRMGRWALFDKRTEESVDISRTWSGVEPWSAETPSLYTAVVRLRNEKMEEEEVVGLRFGFRTVTIKDGVLLLNGKAITLKGVTYGVEHTEGYASREKMRKDVLAMKRNNVNAVRTSRYSPMDSYFYSLCDQYGIYVVADANLMPASSHQHVVATDQEFIPMFEKRVENLYSDNKNHSSIIVWTLGDTRDNGVCMTAAYKRLKAIEKTRPVLFAGAGYGESTDMISLVSPKLQDLKQAVSKNSERPFVMTVSVDEAHFNALEDIWQFVENRRNVHGGFVERWPLGEVAMADLRHIYSPADIKLSKITPDEGEFTVYNLNDFSDFSNYLLEYTIYTNLRPNIISGDLPVAIRGGESDKVSMRIPQMDLAAGEELFVRFNLNTRRKGGIEWQDGSSVFAKVFSLPQKSAAKQMAHMEGTAAEDSSLLVRLAFDGHENWSMNIVARQKRMMNDGARCMDNMITYTAPDGSVMCDVRSTYTFFSSGDIVVDYTVSPTDRVRDTSLCPIVLLPRYGDSLTWFGLDREVIFRKNNSGIVGTYTQAVGEGIGRSQVRWCASNDGGSGLFAEVLGQRCSVRVEKNVVCLSPQQKTASFRVHLLRYENQLPEDLYGYDYPNTTVGMVEPPDIKASELRFSKPLSVTLSSKSKGEIRYTLDGSEPDETSSLYTNPFVLTSTTVVKARVFVKNGSPSFTSTHKFNYDYIVKTDFSRKPNTPYNKNVETALFDGIEGSVDDLTRDWLGFSGKSVTTTLELAKPIDIDYVVLRYAHSPATWAFAPYRVNVLFSSDGVDYGDTMAAELGFDPADEGESEPRVVELRIPVDKNSIGFIKVEPVTVDRIPSWHRAKGLKPWLMVDEVKVVEKTGK